ncbi:hypothetical protein HDK77DRAFT_451036 [Phyllosticta capitalensis]
MGFLFCLSFFFFSPLVRHCIYTHPAHAQKQKVDDLPTKPRRQGVVVVQRHSPSLPLYHVASCPAVLDTQYPHHCLPPQK